MTYEHVGAMIRDARRRHLVSQAELAYRAGTSRLLRAIGERLELRAVPGPRDNRSDEELRADYRDLTPSERLAQAAALSRTLTSITASRDAA
jgi:hypothetical protein